MYLSALYILFAHWSYTNHWLIFFVIVFVANTLSKIKLILSCSTCVMGSLWWASGTWHVTCTIGHGAGWSPSCGCYSAAPTSHVGSPWLSCCGSGFRGHGRPPGRHGLYVSLLIVLLLCIMFFILFTVFYFFIPFNFYYCCLTVCMSNYENDADDTAFLNIYFHGYE